MGGDDEDDRAKPYSLVLYVSGTGARSTKTVANLRRICEQHLEGQHRLEVVDVRSDPERAETAKILITPTLVRESPPPHRRVVGDLSNTEAVLYGLDLDLLTQPQSKGEVEA